MSNKKIIFHSKSIKNNKETSPSPAKFDMPEWYLSQDKYQRNSDGSIKKSYYTDINNVEKQENLLTWKSCPALLDSFITGYYFYTPCDIEIKKENGEYVVVNEKDFINNVNRKSRSFCNVRGEDLNFPAPEGYEQLHFTWNTNWFPQTPKGYSALFVHPLNRFDLPFFTISGVVDCEDFIVGGLIPFFIKKGFEGKIFKGTPFVQIIPIKNEFWELENIFYDEDQMQNHRDMINHKYRIDDPDHTTNYKNKFWIKKNFD